MTNIEDEEFVLDAADLQEANPDLLAAAERVTSGAPDVPAPDLQDPLDGPVTLVAGFTRMKRTEDGIVSEEVRKAWVRELNGEDEERISRARMKNDLVEFTKAVLQAGVEQLGDQDATKDDLDSLVLGDRDFLLLQIARATYGDKLDYPEVTCPECGEEFSMDLSLEDDVPVKRLSSVEETTFTVPLKRGRVAKVTLPTTEVDVEISKAETPAESNTILIAHAVLQIADAKGNATPMQGDLNAARKLGMQDRQTLVEAMADRMPGPQYNEVKFDHEPGCGKEIHLRISLMDLFRGL